MKKIAIQGTLGSYHDIAAHKYFEGEEIELICCANFEDVFTSIRKDSQGYRNASHREYDCGKFVAQQ